MTRRTQIGIAFIMVVTVFIGAWAIWFRTKVTPVINEPGEIPATAGSATLVASDSTRSGVEPTTFFRLTLDQPVTSAALRDHLTVKPPVELKVEREDQGRTYKITPVAALEPDKIYSFTLGTAAGVKRTHQWSFQTRGEFRVLGTLPRHQATGVPANSGIEIQLSHENYGEIDGFFEITPMIAGRFERHKRTVVFVPQQPLAHSTVYTVTLKKGLKQTDGPGTLTEEVVFAFETEPIRTPNQQPVYFEVVNSIYEFAAGETPQFQISYHDKKGKWGSPEVAVQVFRLGDAAAYIAGVRLRDALPWWANSARALVQTERSGLAPVASFQARPLEYPEVYGSYLSLPEQLPPGYYLATFQIDDLAREALFQVTDLSTYTSVTSTQTLVWVNDLETKGPVAGVSLRPEGGTGQATSDQNGVATLPTPAAATDRERPAGVYLHATAPSGKEGVVSVPIGGASYYWGYDQSAQTAGLYWKYLYLDRALYKPEDTVNLWGILQPREPGALPQREVRAELLRNGDWYGYGPPPAALASVTIPIVDGTFTGAFPTPLTQTPPAGVRRR